MHRLLPLCTTWFGQRSNVPTCRKTSYLEQVVYLPAKILTLLLISGFLAGGVQASTGIGDKPHAQAYDHPEHVSIGEPVLSTEITATIEVNIKETKSGYMLFEPDAIQIEKGSVVRFVVNNFGSLDHEFFLGSFDEITKHQQRRRDHPETAHADANSVAISSGTTATLDWNFSGNTNLEFVCLIPGHREAGMRGVIMVRHHTAPKSRN